MSEDRRGAFRRNAFTFGAVETPSGEVGCLVWDLNEAGAQIEFEEAVDLPERIRVRLAPEASMRGASVAWRKGLRAGLSFTE
jgi:hypothetical protein